MILHVGLSQPFATRSCSSKVHTGVAIAIQSGADVYGGDTSMPGTVWGKWNVVGKRTIEQMWESRTDACGGGLRMSSRSASASSD